MSKRDREIRFELLRPAQLLAERERCPLVFLPIGPLEYHGPHLPLGTDPLNARLSAEEACRRLGKGVVLPTLCWGTERERPDFMLESLGFSRDDWVVGMDFPGVPWKSHYCPEHVFGLVLADQIETLIEHGYKVIEIVNGHGAVNQLAVIERLAGRYSRTREATVIWDLTVPEEMIAKNLVGHADHLETSLMMYLEKRVDQSLVDLSALPEKGVPIRYRDFSIVDGPGFTRTPDPERIVRQDPRDSSAETGRGFFEAVVGKIVRHVEQACPEPGRGGD